MWSTKKTRKSALSVITQVILFCFCHTKYYCIIGPIRLMNGLMEKQVDGPSECRLQTT